MKSTRHTLSNIVLPTLQDPLGGWGLYCRCESGDECPQALEEGVTFTGTADFFTYFNACSWGKLQRYTQIDTVFLELVVDKLTGVFQWVGRSEGDVDTVPLETGLRLSYFSHVKLPDGSYVVTIELPKNDKEVVGFTIQTREPLTVKEGSYYTLVDEADINPVVLALCTTTFQKEDYIIPNIELVKSQIIESDEPIAECFEFYVVDNGQTLDADALSSEHVQVLPNKNVGGAGGFTRGMMEAIASEHSATHVLLMDDDVSIFPESIKRTFNLLSLCKGDYADAFINGAMLSLNQPNRLYEDVSYVRRSGGYHRVKPDLFIDRASDIVMNEAISVEVPNAYGAWWFSCIPVKRIKEIGLPLPLFIRCDDVDYGLRAQALYMTMNGICVWHESFEERFRPSVDCYQYVRNYLIAIATDNIANEQLFLARVERDIRFNMRFMSYDTVELLIEGVEDYLKGPDFIERAAGDAIMKEKSAKNEQFISLDELDLPCLDPIKEKGVTPDRERSPMNILVKLWRTLPYDRHWLPTPLLGNRMAPAVYTSSSRFAWGSMLTTTIAAVDHHANAACVRTLDRDRYEVLMKRWRALKRDYRKRGAKVREAYRAAQPKLTSWEFWNDYLGTDLHQA